MKPRYVKLWADLWGRINNPMAYLLFVYLLQRAEVKDNKVAKRGQILTSIDALSKCLHMSKTSVRRNLQKLATGGLVGTLSGASGTVVTICDYDGYNGVPDEAAHLADPSEEDGIYRKMLEDLDARTGSNFATRKVAEWRKAFNGRRSDGATEDDFVSVHKLKVAEWQGTDQQKFLNPSTLYRQSNFWKYREAARVAEAKKSAGVDDLL